MYLRESRLLLLLKYILNIFIVLEEIIRCEWVLNEFIFFYFGIELIGGGEFKVVYKFLLFCCMCL